MKLDPNIEKFLLGYNQLALPALNDVHQHRIDYMHFALYHAGKPLNLPRIEDHFVDAVDGYQISIRIYTPIRDVNLPCLLYFHGGGWQKGDLATHDSICRNLAYYSQCCVVAVDWRLAPEHPFPMGIQDACAVYLWLLENGSTYNIDINRIGIGGDSAGGNITAAVFQEIKNRNLKMPIFQLLLYASLDFSCSSESYRQFSQGYLLTTQEVNYYINTYLSANDQKTNAMASPILQTDLTYLPRTHIVYCGYDPLRGDSERYISKLQHGRVQVTSKCYEEMIHACLHMNHTVPAVNDMLREIGIITQQALST